jgi:hypothetical protein
MTMNEEPLEQAIDQAVREAMSVDTDASFRTRVLERVQQRGRHLTGRARLTAALAVAAALVLAAFLARPSNDARRDPVVSGPDPALPAASANADRTSAAAAAGRGSTQPPPGIRPARATNELRAPGRRQVERAVVAVISRGVIEPGVEIVPLARIEPIAVAPLKEDPITPAEIVIAPLTPITELQVAPLSPLGERD